MKAVILAGGMGTRISEESHLRPKPMIEVGGRPILWHIMKIYSHYGITDFVICLGYRGYLIKEYFANYFLHNADVTIDARSNDIHYHTAKSEPWRVTLVDTGEHTLTGGRLKNVASYLTPDEPFCFTYGDGVADINIAGLVSFHKAHGKRATVTAVIPPGMERFLSSATGSWILSRSRQVTAILSMAASSCLIRRSPILSMVLTLRGRARRWSGLSQPENSWRSVIPDFGNLWTRCAIVCIWNSSGRAAMPPGRLGRERRRTTAAGILGR